MSDEEKLAQMKKDLVVVNEIIAAVVEKLTAIEDIIIMMSRDG